ncbi:MAG: caspase family protein, partial [Acidimicrobiales bacterium]
MADEPPVADVAIAPPPETFEEAAAPAEPPPAPLVHGASADVTPGEGTWAVSIGIDDYPGSRYDLRSAVADAVEVDRALSRYGVPVDQRLLITDRAANAETIERSIEWLVAHAGPKANAVLFYAGHVRKVHRATETIVAADGRLVTDARVAELLAPLAAPRAWIAIAACYGGGFTEVLAPGRILTGAAGADDLAYENVDYGRSYLVEYMVRRAMVGGDAPGSVEASFAYAADAIARDHPNRVPVQQDWLDGELALGNAAP